ncbi:DUF6777 domain-containing protein [Streptomyces sp. NBC_00525]|uniref:DUF6777 domain-containing protein n=1 Tax=Streptomyces sp. NBC_00525 TaxID=2903660 RepID=UPI002E814019|nr:DUF6777 domain-containing protein [Streptomyces sp. NBC_00525]WUC97216.1 hypothetical protein OG710_27995 [Streptomyces sp. NBC_00525]
MHVRIRPRRTSFALLCAGFLLAAGCGSGSGGPAGEPLDVVLQPAADPGTAPFTASTAGGAAAFPDATRSGAVRSPSPGGGTKALRRAGSTPGLYAGTRAVPSCDVEAQIRMLAVDPAREEAFARTLAVAPDRLAGFLRGLTPVQLRADTLVTGHGFLSGSVLTYQSVLQAGTAVMVDSRGVPRVRCVCGNPLGPPDRAADAATAAGEGWEGFDPARTVVVEPAARPVAELVIADEAHHSWIARPAGDQGAGDRVPEVPPPYDPGTDITGPLPDVPPPDTRTPRPPTESERPEEPADPTSPSPSRSPEDCPTSAAPPPEATTPTPPGEPAVAGDPPVRTRSGTLPARAPGETRCPAPTGEPPEVPPEPEEPSMSDEPPTSISLPRGHDPGDGPAARW